jgi:hypothetical protein
VATCAVLAPHTHSPLTHIQEKYLYTMIHDLTEHDALLRMEVASRAITTVLISESVKKVNDEDVCGGIERSG